MVLVDYSSSDDENSNAQQPSLPSFSIEVEADTRRFFNAKPRGDPFGRVRTFAHDHGNWATSVFIPASEDLMLFIHSLLKYSDEIFSQYREQFHPCDDIHLSLSKTWPVLHHWIPGLVEEIRQITSNQQKHRVVLHEATFLINDEGTRSFLSLGVKKSPFLVDFVNKLDHVVTAYRGDPYYKDPIFHFSFLWCLGDLNKFTSPEWRHDCLASVNEFIATRSPAEGFELTHVVLKTGNRYFSSIHSLNWTANAKSRIVLYLTFYIII